MTEHIAQFFAYQHLPPHLGAVRIMDAQGRVIEVLTPAQFRARHVERPCQVHGRLQCRNCRAYRYALMEKSEAVRRRSRRPLPERGRRRPT